MRTGSSSSSSGGSSMSRGRGSSIGGGISTILRASTATTPAVPAIIFGLPGGVS